MRSNGQKQLPGSWRKWKGVTPKESWKKMKLVGKNPFHYIKSLKGVPLYSLNTGK